MYKSIYHLGYIPAPDLNNLKGFEALPLLYIMGTVIALLWVIKMANSVVKYGVMRLSHGIELVNMDALDLLEVEDYQLVAHLCRSHSKGLAQRTDQY